MALVSAFTVVGQAKPQGSTRTRTYRDARTGHVKTAITHSNRDSLLQWRQDIRAAVQLEAPTLAAGLLRGPIAIRIRFAFPKPPSVPKRRVFPIVAPDLDKLIRAVGDAFEKTVLLNDAQIVHWDCWKVYTDGRAEARIEIWQPDAIVPMPTANPFEQRGLFDADPR